MRASKKLLGVSSVMGPGDVMAAEGTPPDRVRAAVRLGSTGRFLDVPGASALAQGYVYAVLADLAASDGTVPDEIALLDKHGQCVRMKTSTAAIGRAACGMSKRGAQRMLDALRDAKLLRIVDRAGRAPLFVPSTPPPGLALAG